MATEATASSENAEGWGPATKVKVRPLAAPYRTEVAEEIKALLEANPRMKAPRLVALLANEDPMAEQYANWTAKTFKADGVDFKLQKVAKDELEKTILQLNKDETCHGVLVYWPVFGLLPTFFGSTKDDYLADTIAFKKDVEGLCHTYRKALYRSTRFLHDDDNFSNVRSDSKCICPCTPLGVVKILEGLEVYDNSQPIGRQLAGKSVTIINRSDIFGRPLAAMLGNDGAQVFSIDIKGVYVVHRVASGLQFRKPAEDGTEGSSQEDHIAHAIRSSSVIVASPPPCAYRLPLEHVQPGTVVINVATPHHNMDREAVMKIPGVRYVPSTGSITVAMLERNLLRLFKQYHMPAYSKGRETE